MEGEKDKNAAVLIRVAFVVITVLASFGAYQWRRWERVRRVKQWLEEYLLTVTARCPVA